MKAFLALVFIISVALIFNYAKPVSPEIAKKSDKQGSEVMTSTTTENSKTVSYNDKSWKYELIRAADLSEVDLIYNYELKLNSEEIIKDGKCKTAINGGFYQENFQPIGGIVINSELKHKYSKNSLFNGFIGFNKDEKRAIINYGWDEKKENVLQSGPILVHKGKEINLSLTRDKQARRMVAIDDVSGLIFATVYGTESLLDGPLLVDLPFVLNEIGNIEKIEIENAINLDGGSASTWYSSNLNLKEWQPVGSVWCVKS